MSNENILTKETWLDKSIMWLAPQTGVRRLHARMMHDMAVAEQRKFEAAGMGRRFDGWKTSNSSANAESRMSLKRLQARSRDLVRNEGYATRCVTALKTNIIGEGILAKAKAKTSGRASIFQAEWDDWAQSTDCDYDGVTNFYGIQALVMKTIAESGEVLVRRVRRPSSFGLSLPFQLQILEPDFIDESHDGEKFENGNFTVQGIEFDNQGRRAAYWLYTSHPGDIGAMTFKGITSVRVNAEDILHLFRVDRAGQVRGIPWMAPIMLKIKDLSDYSDFTLARQKVSACFTAFITTPDSFDAVGVAGKKAKPPVIGAKLEPQITEQLPPGYSVEFANPPTAGDFSQFTNAQLRGISAGIGVTYEILTNDYSQVNFSSGRMGWQEFQRNIDEWRAHLIIPRLCVPVWRWFTDAMVVAGYGTDKVSTGWTAPRREMIDPATEIEARKEEVRSGFISLPEAIRQNGYDPEEVFKEAAETNKKLDELGLVFDSDARKDFEVKQLAAKKETGKKPGEKKVKSKAA